MFPFYIKGLMEMEEVYIPFCCEEDLDDYINNLMQAVHSVKFNIDCYVYCNDEQIGEIKVKKEIY